jgi:hypothetical protein
MESDSSSALFITSGAPWSPGHTLLETELLFLHQQAFGGNPPRVKLLHLPGQVSLALQQVYGDHLLESGIEMVTSIPEIHSLLNSHSNVVIGSTEVSVTSHVLSGIVSPHTESKAANIRTIWEDLSGGKLKCNFVSTQYYHTILNSYVTAKLVSKASFLPRVNLSTSEQLIPAIADKNIVLINIREHEANNSAPCTVEDYLPLIKYLLHKDYLVVDVGNTKKSFRIELEQLGVIPYWSFPGISFVTDIDLFSRASFFVGSGGITHLALSMNIPTIWTSTVLPNCAPLVPGYHLPCRLYSRRNLSPLSVDESLALSLNGSQIWQDGFDSHAKKWESSGVGPWNRKAELEADYFIVKPHGINLLRTFQLLESETTSKASNASKFHEFKMKDVLGRQIFSGPISPFF